jgi:hypothetical protein
VANIDGQWFLHGGRKNPQGDLLGFDHAGRGHTMLEDWKAPRS